MSSADVNIFVSGVEISTSLPSTTDVAAAAEAIIWFMASETAESSSSESSSASGSSGSSIPIIDAARLRAPSSVIRKTLRMITL